MTWKLSDAKLATRDEVERLFKIMKRDPDDYSFFATAANTGLRLCECLHLRVDHLHEAGISITRRKKRKLVSEIFPTQDEVLKILKLRAAALLGKDSWLWPGNCKPCERTLHLRKKVDGEVVKRWTERQQICNGGHLHKREIQRRWRNYVEEAGIYRPGFGVHSLRHHFGTEMYQATRDLRVTQVALGHSSPEITCIYAHVVDLADQVRKMKAVL